jgi:hypothetical protein
MIYNITSEIMRFRTAATEKPKVIGLYIILRRYERLRPGGTEEETV